MKNFLMAVMVGFCALIYSVNADAWCITQFKKTANCEAEKSVYMMTDVETENYVIGFCVNLDQFVDIYQYFKVENAKDLVGKCHEAGTDWKNAPLIIKTIDQILLIIQPPKKEKPVANKNSI